MVKINRPAGAITGVLADVQNVLSIILETEKITNNVVCMSDFA